MQIRSLAALLAVTAVAMFAYFYIQADPALKGA